MMCGRRGHGRLRCYCSCNGAAGRGEGGGGGEEAHGSTAVPAALQGRTATARNRPEEEEVPGSGSDGARDGTRGASERAPVGDGDGRGTAQSVKDRGREGSRGRGEGEGWKGERKRKCVFGHVTLPLLRRPAEAECVNHRPPPPSPLPPVAFFSPLRYITNSCLCARTRAGCLARKRRLSTHHASRKNVILCFSA